MRWRQSTAPAGTDASVEDELAKMKQELGL